MFDYDKEINGCINCKYNNSQHLEAIDFYVPIDRNLCIQKKCEHVENNRNKKIINDLIRADVVGSKLLHFPS